jgi:hypothetical protein
MVGSCDKRALPFSSKPNTALPRSRPGAASIFCGHFPVTDRICRAGAGEGIDLSSSAWKTVAASTIFEVITENETQNSSWNVNRFSHLPQRSNGDAMGIAIRRTWGAQFSPRRRGIEDYPEAWQLLGPRVRRYRLFPYGLVYRLLEGSCWTWAST